MAYALQQAKASTAEQAFHILQMIRRDEGGLSYWGREQVPQPPYKIENQKPFSLPRLPYTYDAENIEATAYALLVHVARQEVEVDPIVKWLNAQRLQNGGWASTQDTVWAMKSLMEYTSNNRIRAVTDIQIIIEASSLPGSKKTLRVTNDNLAKLQVVEVSLIIIQDRDFFYSFFTVVLNTLISSFRFHTPGVRSKCKLGVPDTRFYRCTCNTTSTSRGSKRNHRFRHLNSIRSYKWMEEINLTYTTTLVKGVAFHKLVGC